LSPLPQLQLLHATATGSIVFVGCAGNFYAGYICAWQSFGYDAVCQGSCYVLLSIVDPASSAGNHSSIFLATSIGFLLTIVRVRCFAAAAAAAIYDHLTQDLSGNSSVLLLQRATAPGIVPNLQEQYHIN
jgi:hypothetical protein